MEHPRYDLTPYDYLHLLNKTWVCSPGECQHYSRAGFILLGLIQAERFGNDTWLGYD